MFSKKSITKLQQLFLDKYGIKLSRAEAIEEGYDLLYLYAFGLGEFELLEPILTLQEQSKS